MDILAFLISALLSLTVAVSGNQNALPAQKLPPSEQSINPVERSTCPEEGCSFNPGYTEPSQPETVRIAQCLTDKGVKFYGAFWCPHCAEQKEQFGEEATKHLTYIECDPRGQNADPEACMAAGIERYPTWIFPGQNPIIGVYDPEYLATVAGCTK